MTRLLLLSIVSMAIGLHSLQAQNSLTDIAGKWEATTTNGTRLYIEIQPTGRYQLSAQAGGGSIREEGVAEFREGAYRLKPDYSNRPREHVLTLKNGNLAADLDVVTSGRRSSEVTFTKR